MKVGRKGACPGRRWDTGCGGRGGDGEDPARPTAGKRNSQASWCFQEKPEREREVSLELCRRGACVLCVPCVPGNGTGRGRVVEDQELHRQDLTCHEHTPLETCARLI